MNKSLKILALFLVLFLMSCGASKTNEMGGSTSPQYDKKTQSGSGTGTGDSGDGGSIGHAPDSGSDGGSIAHFKPALAVRGTGCIMCHGKVEANIITDFGYGNSYYFGQSGVGGLNEFSGSIYGDHAQNWATGAVWGKIFVPQAPVTLSGMPATLASYLSGVVTPPDAMTAKPAVVPQSSIYIGAPTANRILAAAGSFPNGHWKYTSYTTTGFNGLEVSANQKYVQNVQGIPFVCEGDLIVNDVLFLDHLQLQTNNNGCRIYVTKSVFIQGPITFLGSDPYRNLQITSSRMVGMGMGYGNVDSMGTIIANNSLVNRFQTMWTVPGFFTREAGSTTDKLNTILNESFDIPTLTDANSQPEGRGVAFQRLLINTPNFQSRYQGEFKGVIIAELALASLGDFAFKFDDVFSHVPILPLIPETDYLSITP